MIALVVMTALAYWNTLGNEFIWDDTMLVVNNSYIRNFSYLGPAFRTDLFHGNSSWVATHYRPLQTVSYMLDYAVWGLNPFGYHLTNLLLHALCAVLVFALVRRIFEHHALAFATALLFAVHPVNTNGITYIAGRADPMAFAGMLGALLLFDAYRKNRNLTIYAASLVCYAAALFSRESALLFPVLLVLYIVFVKAPWRAIVPFVLLAIAFAILRQVTLAEAQAWEGRPTAIAWALPVSVRWQIPFRSLATYLGLLIWPAHLQMERQVVFGHPMLPALTMAGVIAFVLLVAGIIVAWRRSRPTAFGLLWFVLLLVPMLGVLNLNATVAEHWVYMASVGFYLAIVSLGLKLPARIGYSVFGAVIIALMARTISRNTDWTDAATFYARTAKAAPYSASVRANLSRQYAEGGRTDRAFEELLAAERLDPQSAPVKLKLAVAHMVRGDEAAARRTLDECLTLAPRNMSALLLAAEFAEADGDLYRARQCLLTAMDAASNPLPAVHYAQFLLRQKEFDKAVTVARQAVALEPGNANLHNLLGVVLAETGQFDEAQRAFEKAARLDRHSPDAKRNLQKLERLRH